MKNQFKNKKILIMGLGLNGGGVGVAKFFCKQRAEVLITDLKTEKQLKESLDQLKKFKVKYSLGGHKEADFLWADMIIKNPDVPNSSPYLEVARKNNKLIETDVDLFFKLAGKAFIIGITGTKGKSTTASLIYHIVKEAGRKVFLAGNIGISPLDLLAKIKEGDIVVLELSSFELEGLNQSPNIAVVTNILEDHLNRYASMSEYVNAKKRIFKFQKNNDVLVLNADDSIVRQFETEADSKVCYFSKEERLKGRPDSINLKNFSLFGQHNLSNLLAAIKVSEILKIPAKKIQKGIKTFRGVPNRQEFVREFNGVKYFNDTTATIPEAVIAAIDSFSEKFPNSKIFLICGGVYKGVHYEDMAKKIREKQVAIILLPGSGSDKIKDALPGYENIDEVSSMQEAVKKAVDMAQKGSVVVLSPAASSFNMFKNEFDRGEQFIKAVMALKQNEKTS